MTASIDAAPPAARSAIILRYYLAMAMPFVVDVVTLCAYAAVNQEPEILLPSFLQSAIFLVIGVGGSAYFLIRPIRRFIARHTRSRVRNVYLCIGNSRSGRIGNAPRERRSRDLGGCLTGEKDGDGQNDHQRKKGGDSSKNNAT